jgi:hypothetical protein
MAGYKNAKSVFARKPRRGEAHGRAEHKNARSVLARKPRRGEAHGRDENKKLQGAIFNVESDGPKGGSQGWQTTKTPGAFLRASPGGVKHMDVLNTKKGRINPALE